MKGWREGGEGGEGGMAGGGRGGRLSSEVFGFVRKAVPISICRGQWSSTFHTVDGLLVSKQ